jgi:hypothetical protein
VVRTQANPTPWSGFFLPVTPFCWVNVSLISIYLRSWAFSTASIKEIDSALPTHCNVWFDSHRLSEPIATFHPLSCQKCYPIKACSLIIIRSLCLQTFRGFRRRWLRRVAADLHTACLANTVSRRKWLHRLCGHRIPLLVKRQEDGRRWFVEK